MLRKLREARDEEGFTLIELLVVVIIIGILAAIAIPVFLNQREKAYARTAESDARNAAVVEESYFADNNAYVDLAATAGPQVVDIGGGNDVAISDAVTLTITADYNGAGTFCITTDHSQTTASPDATYKSDAGGLQDTPGAC